MVPYEDPNLSRTSPPWRHAPTTDDQEFLDELLGDLGVALDALWTEYKVRGYTKESGIPGRAESTFKGFVTWWVSHHLTGKGA
jgi:hypothetical protein